MSKRRADECYQAEVFTARQRTPRHPGSDLEDQAAMALEKARAMPSGPDRSKAIKRALNLRSAADLVKVVFARQKGCQGSEWSLPQQGGARPVAAGNRRHDLADRLSRQQAAADGAIR